MKNAPCPICRRNPKNNGFTKESLGGESHGCGKFHVSIQSDVSIAGI